VYSDGERLRFESYFGVATRVKSTTLKIGATTVLAVASARLGLGYAGIVALLAIVAGIYDSIRWQLTEHAVTRITTISALAAMETLPARRMTGQTSSQLLRSGEASQGGTADRVHVRERRDD